MAGAGLDADIVYHLNSRMKEAFGKVAYWIGGFSKLGRRIPEFTVEADGREFRASFALLSRVRNYGGDLEIAPTISLLDDEFEMVLFEGESSLGFLKYMLGVVAHQQQSMRGITILRTRQAAFSVAGPGWTDSCAGGRRVRRRCAGARRDCSQRTNPVGASRIFARGDLPASTPVSMTPHGQPHPLADRLDAEPSRPESLLSASDSGAARCRRISRTSISWRSRAARCIISSSIAASRIPSPPLPVMALLSALLACAIGRTMRGWLAAWGLAIIGVASHLLLDWTNTYGIRLLLPFSSQWFHLDLNNLFRFAGLGGAAAGLVGAADGKAGQLRDRGEIRNRPRHGDFRAVVLSDLRFRPFSLAPARHRDLELARCTRTVRPRAWRHFPPRGVSPFEWQGWMERPEFVMRFQVNVRQEFDPAAGAIIYKPAPSPAIDAASQAHPVRVFLRFAQYPLWSVSAAGQPGRRA